ncbi:MAG: DUF4830 domain-containing protein [Oscillospiraceae bacterium]|nr:DUF4830 domain-containing protein [Oscillospiraceae bacterium]
MKKFKLKSNTPLFIIVGICVALIVLFIISRFGVIIDVGENTHQSNIDLQIEVSDVSKVINFLENAGWEIVSTPSDVRLVTIPKIFDELYEEYNKLQQSQGFDLNSARGKTATMYTFRVTNHSSNHKNVFANILMSDETIIAGDIVSYALDGFLEPII